MIYSDKHFASPNRMVFTIRYNIVPIRAFCGEWSTCSYTTANTHLIPSLSPTPSPDTDRSARPNVKRERSLSPTWDNYALTNGKLFAVSVFALLIRDIISMKLVLRLERRQKMSKFTLVMSTCVPFRAKARIDFRFHREWRQQKCRPLG